MGCHLLCSDGLGCCMAIFTYLVMFGGNALFFFTAIYHRLGTDGEVSAIIEYGAYLIPWSLMVISHLCTMCVDPGFIPESYLKYNEENLVAPFKTLQGLEFAIEKGN